MPVFTRIRRLLLLVHWKKSPAALFRTAAPSRRLPDRIKSDRLLVAFGAACQLAVAAQHATPAQAPIVAEREKLEQQVTDTERAFAKTMADRDHAAFSRFLADEAVFFSGPTPLRGKQQVSEGWKRFYEKPDAPFSWKPEQVQVLDSGTLALSTGPVFDPSGKQVGTFTSIWRLEAPGTWRIIFDKGCDVCERCAKP